MPALPHEARSLLAALPLVISLSSGCFDPACYTNCEPQTLVTVTDGVTGNPICGATVIAARPTLGEGMDASSGVPLSYVPASDGGCTGVYEAVIIRDPTDEIWSVRVDAPGYAPGMTSIHGLAMPSCGATTCVSQTATVVLSPP